MTYIVSPTTATQLLRRAALVIQSTLTTSIVKYLFRFVTYCYGTLFAQNSFVVVVHNSTSKRVGCKLLYPSPQKRLFTLAALRKSKKGAKVTQQKSCQKLLFQCENTVSRKCEYGVLEITSDTKVSSHESKTSDLTRLLYHA